MKYKRTKHTEEEYYQILKMYQEGKTAFDIHKIIPYLKKNTIYHTISYFKSYKLTGKISKNGYKNSKIENAIQHIINDKLPESKNIGNDKIEDNLSKLEKSFTDFQNSIVEVIESEANRRSNDKLKKSQEHYDKEINKLEGELNDLRKVVEVAKNTNVVGFLRKKWLGKE